MEFHALTSDHVETAPAWAAAGDLLPDRWRDESTRAAGSWSGATLVAVGRIYPSRVHRSRYWTEVIVAPEERGQGYGRAMVLHLAALRSESKPLCTRGYASCEAVSFARHLGARTYQTCPPEQVRTTDAARLATSGLTSRTGREIGWAELQRAWVDTYSWVHDSWSPVTPGAEPLLLDGLDDELSLDHSRFITTPTVRAGAFAFLDDPLPVVVAECRTPEEADGLTLLRACVRDCLTSLAAAGISTVTFDGHDTDPHFRPVLAELPVTGEAFELLEWTPEWCSPTGDRR